MRPNYILKKCFSRDIYYTMYMFAMFDTFAAPLKHQKKHFSVYVYIYFCFSQWNTQNTAFNITKKWYSWSDSFVFYWVYGMVTEIGYTNWGVYKNSIAIAKNQHSDHTCIFRLFVWMLKTFNTIFHYCTVVEFAGKTRHKIRCYWTSDIKLRISYNVQR